MAVMAKKKPKRSGGPLQLYIPPWLKTAVEQMAKDGRRSRTSEVIMALESHVRAAGYLPPKGGSPPAK
jgi:hypothetical protein